jgi:hypothetical protein
MALAFAAGLPIGAPLIDEIASKRAGKITERFGVDPGTVQRISRPFDRASVAV